MLKIKYKDEGVNISMDGGFTPVMGSKQSSYGGGHTRVIRENFRPCKVEDFTDNDLHISDEITK